jgi:hydroxyethylthiazole kinase-like uncharacterized protein yjeF
MAKIESRVYSPDNVREMDRIAIEDLGVPGYTLMTRAGRAAFNDAREYFPDARRWLVICGAGNNAGDGYIIARLACAAHLDVTVVALSDPEALTGDAARAWRDYADTDRGGADAATVAFDVGLCADVDLIVDAVLGTGLTRPLGGEFLRVVEAVGQVNTPVISIDVPSGLNSASGEIMGAAVKATVTSTFVGLKQGFFLGAGPDYTGKLILHDLEIPLDGVESVAPTMAIFGSGDLHDLMPPRAVTAHKGRFGHVLVVGGNHGMAGAARMAGEAALRAGAGLVSVASRPENIGLIATCRPELMCHGISSVDDLEPLIARATVIALGPGLGQDDWANALYRRVSECAQPKILDADALNLLAQNPVSRGDWILTPHPGEAARLLGDSTASIQNGRLEALANLVDRYGGIVVLKGRGTLIGQGGAMPYVVNRGNAGMATAGMGDVLTGLTAGLVAQYPDSLQKSAAAAAYAHAVAGDLAAGAGQRGLIATDLFAELRTVLNPDGAHEPASKS